MAIFWVNLNVVSKREMRKRAGHWDRLSARCRANAHDNILLRKMLIYPEMFPYGGKRR